MSSAEKLWRELVGELEAFVRARVRDEATADDVLQTAFLRAYRHLERGAPPTHPRAWLFQIVRNLILDAARAERRAQNLSDRLEREPEPTLEDPDDAFALVALGLPSWIAQLPPPYRRALELTELEGLTQAEAARQEGVTVTAMKSRVRRARQKLHAALLDCCRFEVDARGRVLDFTPHQPSCGRPKGCDCR